VVGYLNRLLEKEKSFKNTIIKRMQNLSRRWWKSWAMTEAQEQRLEAYKEELLLKYGHEFMGRW
jgi:hypothetical protein